MQLHVESRPAHSATNAAPLPPAAAARLRELWAELDRIGRFAPRPDLLRDAARVIGPAARRAGMFAEHLVIAIRADWRRDARLQASRGNGVSDVVVSELVSLCVQEFYAAVAPNADVERVVRRRTVTPHHDR